MLLEYIQTGLLLLIGTAVLASRRTAKDSGDTHKIVLDTCAIIDGRIVELVRNGFVRDRLVVPDFVVHELQMLADGQDAHKRGRARYGLDVVRELQDLTAVTIMKGDQSRLPTDDKLVALAKKLKAPLYTTDYNLNKVADIQSVTVLNVNELAQSMRPTAIPGEITEVKLLQKGSNPKQAVGYMDDGTMVVVDNATRLIGKTVNVEVTRVHQTVAGKMFFASLRQAEKPNQPRRRVSPTRMQ